MSFREIAVAVKKKDQRETENVRVDHLERLEEPLGENPQRGPAAAVGMERRKRRRSF